MLSALPITADPTTANTAFVEAVYQDVLGRQADPAGLAWGVAQINGGGSRTVFVEQLAYSDEAHSRLIQSAYQQFLRRDADAPGMAYWLIQMRGGAQNEAVQAAFLASDEFYARAGGTDAAWIAAAYQSVLGRPADAPAVTWVTDRLAAGTSRYDLAMMLLTSTEGESRVVERELSQFHGSTDSGTVLTFASELSSHELTQPQLVVGYLASPQYYEAHTGVPTTIVPVPNALPQALRDAAHISSQAAQGNANVVFVGDSITAYWQTRGQASWDGALAPLGSLDAGIGGDLIENVLWRLDQGNLRGISPKLAVVMIGINDLARGSSPTDTAAGINAVVRTLQSEFPDARILLLGVLPGGQLAANNVLRQEITAVNQLIAPLADGQRIWFLDLSADFVNADGSLNQSLFQPDLVHPSPQGYQVMAQIVAPWVQFLAS